MKDLASSYENLLNQLFLTEQVDALHVSLINLLEMAIEGEIELVLEQTGKSLKQKSLFIDKIIKQLPSAELKALLHRELEEGNIEFFSQNALMDWLRTVQREAERIKVVKLTVAIDFKEKDLRQMADAFGKQIGSQAAFEIKTDRSLIGGAIIQYGTYISDYSLKSRLQQFRTHWRKAALTHES
jgi:F0F1-type ATP synthase delta subunit